MNKIINGIILVISMILMGITYYNFKDLLVDYTTYIVVFISIVLLIFAVGFITCKKWLTISQWIIKSLILILIGALCFSSFYYEQTVSRTVSSTVKYQTYIISRKDSDIKTIDDLKEGQRIGVLRPGNIEAYDMAKTYLDTLNKNFVYEQQSYYQQMFKDFMAKKIDVIVLNSLSDATITDYYPNLKDLVTVLKHIETTKTVETKGVEDVSKDPILIYLSGIDTRQEIIDINTKSDVNMLLAFNPNTFTLDMVSVPRDSYIPLPCENNEPDKLTYAGWQGVGCSIGAINQLLDVEINYYAKVNFFALEDIISFYGDITIDNTYDLCLSTRCIKPGKVTLNEKEALEYARIRHVDSDRQRTDRQRILVTAILKQSLQTFDLDTLNKLVKITSSNVRTNIEAHNMFKLFSLIYNHQSELTINSYDIAGKGQNIYLPYYNITDYSKKLTKKSIESVKKRLYTTLEMEYPDEKN